MSLVLARLLVPADFGLVAMAMSIIAFIDIATTLSFDIALIQKTRPQPGALRHRVDAEHRGRNGLCVNHSRPRLSRCVVL